MSDLSYSFSSSFREVKLSWYHMVQGPNHKSHCLHRLSGLTQGSQINKDILTGRTFQGLEVTFQKSVKGQTFLWNICFEYPIESVLLQLAFQGRTLPTVV